MKNGKISLTSLQENEDIVEIKNRAFEELRKKKSIQFLQVRWKTQFFMFAPKFCFKNEAFQSLVIVHQHMNKFAVIKASEHFLLLR